MDEPSLNPGQIAKVRGTDSVPGIRTPTHDQERRGIDARDPFNPSSQELTIDSGVGFHPQVPRGRDEDAFPSFPNVISIAQNEFTVQPTASINEREPAPIADASPFASQDLSREKVSQDPDQHLPQFPGGTVKTFDPPTSKVIDPSVPDVATPSPYTTINTQSSVPVRPITSSAGLSRPTIDGKPTPETHQFLDEFVPVDGDNDEQDVHVNLHTTSSVSQDQTPQIVSNPSSNEAVDRHEFHVPVVDEAGRSNNGEVRIAMPDFNAAFQATEEREASEDDKGHTHIKIASDDTVVSLSPAVVSPDGEDLEPIVPELSPQVRSNAGNIQQPATNFGTNIVPEIHQEVHTETHVPITSDEERTVLLKKEPPVVTDYSPNTEQTATPVVAVSQVQQSSPTTVSFEAQYSERDPSVDEQIRGVMHDISRVQKERSELEQITAALMHDRLSIAEQMNPYEAEFHTLTLQLSQIEKNEQEAFGKEERRILEQRRWETVQQLYQIEQKYLDVRERVEGIVSKLRTYELRYIELGKEQELLEKRILVLRRDGERKELESALRLVQADALVHADVLKQISAEVKEADAILAQISARENEKETAVHKIEFQEGEASSAQELRRLAEARFQLERERHAIEATRWEEEDKLKELSAKMLSAEERLRTVEARKKEIVDKLNGIVALDR